MKKIYLNFGLLLVLGFFVATFNSCTSEEDDGLNSTVSPYVGTWVCDKQSFDDPYNIGSSISLPQGYIKIEINAVSTFIFYRKVNVGSHYASTEGTIYEESLKGTYDDEKFTITDVNNDDDGKWYGSVNAALDEKNGGDDDKIEDASGIVGFFAPTFTGKIIENKLVIYGLKFSKL